MRTLFSLIVFTMAVAVHSSPALAWGCVAEAEDGASGWSNSYKNMRDARSRALDECENNTSESCEITDCNQDW